MCNKKEKEDESYAHCANLYQFYCNQHHNFRALFITTIQTNMDFFVHLHLFVLKVCTFHCADDVNKQKIMHNSDPCKSYYYFFFSPADLHCWFIVLCTFTSNYESECFSCVRATTVRIHRTLIDDDGHWSVWTWT